VLERELAGADVALERSFSTVRPHVTTQVFSRPEAAQAKGTHHLIKKFKY